MNRQASFIIALVASLFSVIHAIFCWGTDSVLTTRAVTFAVICCLITIGILIVWGKDIFASEVDIAV